MNRYVQEFAGRHNLRDEDTLAQMGWMAHNLFNKEMQYSELIAPNGLPSRARS